MAIISQKTFDNFTEEEKRTIRKDYNNSAESVRIRLEAYFGKHNLRPIINTWDDFLKEFHKTMDWNPKNELMDLSLYGTCDKVIAKLIATAKIAKLIEVGYGGMITDKEWRDEYISKWVINCDSVLFHNEEKFEILEMFVDKSFIAFHKESQAEEFMSYPENVELVKQYYMI